MEQYDKTREPKRRKSGRIEDTANLGATMGRTTEDSQNDGTEGQGSVNDQDSGRGNSSREASAKFRSSPLGKILERVELMEGSFYSYVHAHQDRLESRLGESKQLESSFTQELNALKKEIYNLASQQESED